MADPTPVAYRPRPVWRIVLILSLALNLAVAGMIGGAVVAGRLGHDRPVRVDLGLGQLTRALPEADRRAIGRALRQDPGWRGPQMRGQMAALAAALRADPFDPAPVAQLLAQQAAQMQALQARAHGALMDRLAIMSRADRSAMADRLDHAGPAAPERRPDRSGG